MKVNIDIHNLAPKKVDYDLKRNIERKLAKLEKQTSKAISEMVREKLQESAVDSDRINIREMPENFGGDSDDSE